MGKILAVLGLVLLATTASAQSERQQRAAELEEVAVALADPDPMMRLAALEEILASGDRRTIGLATALAMRSEDRALRGAGMVAYMEQQGVIEFDLSYPGPLEEQYQAAQYDADKLNKFFQDAGKLLGVFPKGIHGQGRKFTVVVELDDDQMGGKAFSLMGSKRHEGDLRINGDLAEMLFPTIPLSNRWHSCSLRITPTGEGLIGGDLRCGEGVYPVRFEVR